jgi:hypothetical protein
MDTVTTNSGRATPWNKGKLLGQKPPLKLKRFAARAHHRLESTVRYLGIEVDDALEIAEQTEV